MRFNVESSPHIKANDSTPKIMFRVILALLPAAIYGIILFGSKTIILYVVSILSSIIIEAIVKKVRKRPVQIEDLSAVVTGMLIVMTLPPDATITMTVIGSAVAIIFAKEVFGGLGSNIFNPALVGRAFLQVAFPAQMAIYSAPIRTPFGILGRMVENGANAITGATQTIDLVNALTQASPLSFIKFTTISSISSTFAEQIKFESSYYLQMFVGNTAGAIGETSFMLLLIGGVYLIICKTIDWRIPLGMFISLVVVSGIIWIAIPKTYPSPIYQLLSGGFALGAFFMATDMVTAPSSHLGAWIYALLIGTVLAILRCFGSSPEYTMYAILIGNMFMPLIAMYNRPIPVGKKEAIAIEKSNAGGQ